MQTCRGHMQNFMRQIRFYAPWEGLENLILCKPINVTDRCLVNFKKHKPVEGSLSGSLKHKHCFFDFSRNCESEEEYPKQWKIIVFRLQ